jgi:hypothetical protein
VSRAVGPLETQPCVSLSVLHFSISHECTNQGPQTLEIWNPAAQPVCLERQVEYKLPGKTFS